MSIRIGIEGGERIKSLLRLGDVGLNDYTAWPLGHDWTSARCLVSVGRMKAATNPSSEKLVYCRWTGCRHPSWRSLWLPLVVRGGGPRNGLRGGPHGGCPRRLPMVVPHGNPPWRSPPWRPTCGSPWRPPWQAWWHSRGGCGGPCGCSLRFMSTHVIMSPMLLRRRTPATLLLWPSTEMPDTALSRAQFTGKMGRGHNTIANAIAVPSCPSARVSRVKAKQGIGSPARQSSGIFIAAKRGYFVTLQV